MVSSPLSVPLPTLQDLLSLWERPDEKKSTRRLRKNVIKELIALPTEETQDFVRAFHTASHDILQRESDPFRFLKCRFSPDDTRGAAVQLAKYWTSRCDLFEERAFWPMNLDILPAAELSVFEEFGVGVLLPKDDLGRCVTWWDASDYFKSKKEKKQVNRARMIFFMLQMASEYSDRVVIFRYLEGDYRLQTGITTSGMEYVPVIIDQMVCLYKVPPGSRRILNQQLVPRLPEMYGDFLGTRLSVHIGTSGEELLPHVTAWGLSEDKIPEAAGGTWRIGNFYRWFEEAKKTKTAPPLDLLSNDWQPEAPAAPEDYVDKEHKEEE